VHWTGRASATNASQLDFEDGARASALPQYFKQWYGQLGSKLPCETVGGQGPGALTKSICRQGVRLSESNNRADQYCRRRIKPWPSKIGQTLRSWNLWLAQSEKEMPGSLSMQSQVNDKSALLKYPWRRNVGSQ